MPNSNYCFNKTFWGEKEQKLQYQMKVDILKSFLLQTNLIRRKKKKKEVISDILGVTLVHVISKTRGSLVLMLTPLWMSTHGFSCLMVKKSRTLMGGVWEVQKTASYRQPCMTKTQIYILLSSSITCHIQCISFYVSR